MKTVMKKMFCLLLVAVMLVGAMPFQAFAAPYPGFPGIPGGPGGNEHTHYYVDDGWETTTNPTCTNEGSKTRTCVSPNCNDREGSRQTESIPALTHSFPETWTVSQAPTCDNVGEEVRICTRCNGNETGGRETRSVPALNHTLNDNKCDCGYCDICKANPCECPEIPSTMTVKAVLKKGSDETSMEEDRAIDWSASVEAILVNWFKADPSQFSNAYIYRSNNTKGSVGLTDLVQAGDEIHIRLYNNCDECGQDPCICCGDCDGTITNHDRTCPTNNNNSEKVKVYLNLNYGNAYAYGENIEYVWADKNELLKDVVAGLTEPYREGHHFQHWTTKDGTIIDNYNNTDRATADGVMIYAQWVDIIQSGSGTVDVTVNLNYGGLVEYINNIVSGVEMGNVLEYAGTPVRLNYKFKGWYWDKKCTDAIESNEKIYKDKTIYAKWEYRDTNNEFLLKVYTNGNTYAPADTIDMYQYTTDDGYVSLSEAKEAVKKYYTAKNSSEGLYFEGLYDADNWLKYVDNKKTATSVGSVKMDYEPGHDTIIYVMVNNAKVRTGTSSSSSSSAKADSTNPKTGDAIYAPVMVLGASASALAVMFYLNKKRAF